MVLAGWLIALLILPWSSHEAKKTPKPVTVDQVSINLDRMDEDKLWLRINNNSEFHISVMNLGTPKSNCPHAPEYYLERVVQRKFTDEDRKAIEAGQPHAKDKTDDELAREHISWPRMISISEERLMNWSDAIAAGCGDLGPQQTAGFEVPLKIALEYERLYIFYDYVYEGPQSTSRSPEHRLYFDLLSLRRQATEK